MYLFQQGPAETNSYFIAGYVVFFTVFIAYITSLIVRWRNLQQDLAVLEDVEGEGG